MKVYCVTFVNDSGFAYEMCYPAINPSEAQKMCEADFEWGFVIKVEEVTS